MSMFIEIAESRERAARIRAILYPHMAADILAANARVESVLEAMYYDTMARCQGYGSPRFSSESEMRAYYDAPFIPNTNLMGHDFDGDPIDRIEEDWDNWSDGWDS